jgi:hypothetical protein
VLEIHNVSRKPALGPAPAAADRPVNSGYSPAATSIAKVFVERTQNALYFDPTMSPEEIAEATGLSDDDVADALYELRHIVENNMATVTGLADLYATFDKHYQEWDPAQDALRIAADFLNDPTFPNEPEEIAERYQWTPRRLNPALSYLRARKLVDSVQVMGMDPWVAVHFEKNDATRRFVKSRT